MSKSSRTGGNLQIFLFFFQKDLSFYDPRSVYQEHLVAYNLINSTQQIPHNRQLIQYKDDDNYQPFSSAYTTFRGPTTGSPNVQINTVHSGSSNIQVNTPHSHPPSRPIRKGVFVQQKYFMKDLTGLLPRKVIIQVKLSRKKFMNSLKKSKNRTQTDVSIYTVYSQ